MGRKNDFTNKIDAAVANKIAELRISMGFSRQQLAIKIGVSHQQLQKYEKNTNRVSIGRLASIAQATGKPLIYFFEGIYEDPDVLPTYHQRMCIEVSRNFLGIKNASHQEAINLLVRNLKNN